MSFDPTINLGTIIAAAVLLLGFLGAHIQNIKRMATIEQKVDLVYNWFVKHVINGHSQ